MDDSPPELPVKVPGAAVLGPTPSSIHYTVKLPSPGWGSQKVVVQIPTTRRFERVPARIPVFLIKEAEGRIVQRHGNTLDVSIRGLRVSTDLPLKPGERVRVFYPEALLGIFRVVWAIPWRSEAGLEVVS